MALCRPAAPPGRGCRPAAGGWKTGRAGFTIRLSTVPDLLTW